MNLHLLLWLACFVVLTIQGFRSRPVYSLAAYLLTFYLSPVLWWWGSPITQLTTRWNLLASLLLLLSVLLKGVPWKKISPPEKLFFKLFSLYAVNAGLVHFLLADNPEESYRHFDLIWKSAILCILFAMCLRDEYDLQVLFLTIVLCLGYIGFAVVFQDQGSNIKGRLEGISIPGASGSNGIACISCMGVIMAGHLAMNVASWRTRLMALSMAPLILEVILRASSRGAFLGLIGSGICFSLITPKSQRKKAFVLLILGAAAVLYQAKNEAIWERFYSIFVSAEERDSSASSRIDFWRAAIEMTGDYPLGSGGKAGFNSVRGYSYIQDISDTRRAIHNGYLTVATSWGIQGFALLAGCHLVAVFSGFRLTRKKHIQSESLRATSAIVLTVLCSQYVCTMFGDYYDGEWFMYLAIIVLVLSRISNDGGVTCPESSITAA